MHKATAFLRKRDKIEMLRHDRTNHIGRHREAGPAALLSAVPIRMPLSIGAFSGTRGVQFVSLAGWPLLSRNRWTGDVRFPGHAVETRTPYFLDVSPGFFETMRIGQIDGRDFRRGDVPPRLNGSTQPLPGAGIVNEAFARTYFNGQNPVGRSVNVRIDKDLAAPMEIVGYVRDAAYYDVREPMHPTVYVPMLNKEHNTLLVLLVHTAGDPLALAPMVRRAVSEVRPDFR